AGALLPALARTGRGPGPGPARSGLRLGARHAHPRPGRARGGRDRPVRPPAVSPGGCMSTAARVRGETAALDLERLRRDFPILSRRVHGKPLVYLDNAATTQKPIPVIEAETRVYEEYYANVHRGVHLLSVASTEEYERVREKIRALIGASERREIVFTRGT